MMACALQRDDTTCKKELQPHAQLKHLKLNLGKVLVSEQVILEHRLNLACNLQTMTGWHN